MRLKVEMPMLMLLFHAGEEKYACRCDHISEIIPQVQIKPIHHMPHFIKGAINYGGKPIPVIDWCLMILDRPCRMSQHTRIILFSLKGFQFGLIAEKVTKTLEAPEEKFIEGGVAQKKHPYLRGVLTEGIETVQFVKTDELLKSLEGFLYEIFS